MEKPPSKLPKVYVESNNDNDGDNTVSVNSPTTTTTWQKIKSFLVQSWFFAKFLESTQAEPDDVVVGKTAIVTAAIKSGKLGEVRVEVRGGNEDYLAKSTEDIARYTTVTIKKLTAGRVVEVEPQIS